MGNDAGKYIRLVVCSVLLSVPLAVLAEDSSSAADTAESEKVCFDTTRVRNHDPLSDKFLFIEQSGGDSFLITMKSRCFGLRNTQVIAFKDTMRRICSGDNFAEVLFRDAGRPMTCRIGNIEKVADKETAKAIVAERIAAETESNPD